MTDIYNLVATTKNRWAECSKVKKGLIIIGSLAGLSLVATGIMAALAATGHFSQLQLTWNQSIKPFFVHTLGPEMANNAQILIPIGSGAAGAAFGASVVLAYYKHTGAQRHLVKLEGALQIFQGVQEELDPDESDLEDLRKAATLNKKINL